MSQSKIDVSLGPVSFSGEGEPQWLAEQLDKVLKSAGEIAQHRPVGAIAEDPSGREASSTSFQTSLASYIREKGGEDNQVKRFLVTADWLRRRGTAQLTTGTVSKALVDNQQKRLANAADSLNKNVSKGFCEKHGGAFYITPEGLKELGE